MKKYLLAGFLLVSHMPCQATLSRSKVKLDTVVLDSIVIPHDNKLQKCIGATALLLGTLSGLDDIDGIKDEECTKSALKKLKLVQKRLNSRQASKDLFDAINKYDYKLSIRLLKDKPNLAINARFNWYKCTALMWCCFQGNESINVVKEILKHPKLDITIKSRDGWTCLHYACNYGRPKITSLLLKREDIGNILNAKDNEDSTPLYWIVWKVKESKAEIGHITTWNMMIAKGAQLSDYKDEYKQLDSDKFKPPYSDYVDLIKSNPPRKVNVPKRS